MSTTHVPPPRTVQLYDRTRPAPVPTSDMIPASTPDLRPATRVAASAVFKTYELFELILLQLPMESVYVVQRVSTIWRDTIARSQDLQKNMFRMAASIPRKPDASVYSQRGVAVTGRWTPAHEIGPIYEGPYLRFNPAISMNFDLSDEAPRCSRRHYGNVSSTSRSFPIEIEVREWENDNQGDFLQFTFQEIDPDQFEHCKYDTAMRSMFITQPPVTGIQLLTRAVRWFRHEARMSLYNPDGITLGDVFDGIHSQVAIDEDPLDEGRQVVLVFSQKVANNSGSAREEWCEICHWVEGLGQD